MDALCRAERALCALRMLPCAFEGDIHDAAALALDREGIAYRREARLMPGCRIDFLIDGGIGLEIKKGRPERLRVLRQLNRYAESGEVLALILLSERGVSLPETVAGKKLVRLSLGRMWGVAT
jgi:hypothetical protein